MKRVDLWILIVAALWMCICVWFVNRPDREHSATSTGSTTSPPLSERLASPSPTFGGALSAMERQIRSALGSQTRSDSSSGKNSGLRSGAPKAAMTVSGHISPRDLTSFKPHTYPSGQPFYPGEPVTAFVRVPSTAQQIAMTVNQGGEYPQLNADPGETVEVLLGFSQTEPGSPVALSAQDGGVLDDGKRTAALILDKNRQVAFSFKLTPNPGLHRIAIQSPTGETKTLEFWVGEPQVIKKLR